MNKTSIYTFLAAILIGCSQSPEQVEVHPLRKTYQSSKRIIVMPTEDIPNVRFEVTGTVTQFNIADRSKTVKVKNNYTYITVKVEKTEPANVALNLPVKELKFSSQTNETRDREISIGDQVMVTVVGNNYTDPTWFRLSDLKKINR